MKRQSLNHSRRAFLASAFILPVAVRAGLSAQTAKPMRIGIIGSGRQGGALGLQWAKAGHEVLFSSRNPGNLKDLVAKAEPPTWPGGRPR